MEAIAMEAKKTITETKADVDVTSDAMEAMGSTKETMKVMGAVEATTKAMETIEKTNLSWVTVLAVVSCDFAATILASYFSTVLLSKRNLLTKLDGLLVLTLTATANIWVSWLACKKVVYSSSTGTKV